MIRSALSRLLLALTVVSLASPQLGSSGLAMNPAPRGPNGTQSQRNVVSSVPLLTAEQSNPTEADNPLERDEWFYSRRVAGDPGEGFTLADAARKRLQAASEVIGAKRRAQELTPSAFTGAWTPVGPDPIFQYGQSIGVRAVSGRIGALAIRSTPPYTMYLGAAQGGVWISSTLTSGWFPKTDQLPSLAIGAIALAPSNENVVYVGTGEGALSGDSYYGNGVLKSIDGGNTFSQVSGTTFNQVSISKIVVDPTSPNHLYAAVLRGRAGARRVGPPSPTPFGIWESADGGVSWTGRLTTTDSSSGATDLVMDPLDPQVLYATLWGQGIYKTVDGGLHWAPAMNGLPANADYSLAPTRFALGISRPSPVVSATLYAGFDWYDTSLGYHASTVWKSTNDGASWAETSTGVVGGYCGSQCWYDNVIAVDPVSSTVVYALGLFDYYSGTGGIFRSMDGGSTWTDLGYGLHPDFHAMAIRRDAPQNILIGNDGGVWASANYGGRLSPGAPASAVDWADLNGFGLQIAQFTSIAQHPTNTSHVYGGTQDNGTMDRPGPGNDWYDKAGGDGGQVIVDPNDPSHVYGTYYGISPYRFDNGMSSSYMIGISNGIDTSDRSEFYIPLAMDPRYTSRLYLGSYRVYRTDNRGDLWMAISPDLTSGCTGPAPNGARGCVLTAFGATAGAPALYTGSADGLVYLSPNADSSTPTWTRVDKAPLPARPVTAFAVDRSNYRLAYVAYGGFGAATPSAMGHVFKTSDGGQTWTNVSGNLPDVPVNSLVLDASSPGTLYAGTDVGPMVTTDGGASWALLGTGFPIVTVWQLDLNPRTRLMRAGTHGRGAWSLDDSSTTLPALQIRSWASSPTVGSGELLAYTITVDNIGNAPAPSVVITDPLPAGTAFVSADSGGTQVGSNAVWNGLAVPAGGSVSVALVVRALALPGWTLTNDGLLVSSAQGVSATGSPISVSVVPSFKVYLPVTLRNYASP